MNTRRLLKTIPAHLRVHADEVGCAAVGFGTLSKPSKPPTPVAGAGWSMRLQQALDWLTPAIGAFRWAHVILTDGTVLWFSRRGFQRVEVMA